ncbi:MULTISPECIES: SRPBCC family protein [unclassified Streptomyces]|uniref:SRPBCC family protein n=1 Tax=unclassified Streptomyces TaxID=2593676 RepID=UPI0033E42F33
MTSIVREFAVAADEKTAWAALADVGAVNKLIPFLGPVTVDGDVRKIDMGEFGIIEELVVTVDDERRRVAYSVRRSPWPLVHHHSSMQILPPAPGESGSRLLWLVDLLPADVAPEFASGMDGAVEAIRHSLAEPAS